MALLNLQQKSMFTSNPAGVIESSYQSETSTDRQAQAYTGKETDKSVYIYCTVLLTCAVPGVTIAVPG